VKISIENENSPEPAEDAVLDDGAENFDVNEDSEFNLTMKKKVNLKKKDLPRKKKTDVSELKERVANLTEELNKREAELVEAENRALRAVADSENYKKRMSREGEDAKKYAVQQVMEAILPALDNLDKAVAVAEKTEVGGQLVQGVEMVVQQLKEALSRKPFDPETSEALQAVEKDDVDDGVVVEEFSPGYSFKDRIIQHAKVVVAKNPAHGSPAEEE